MHRRTPRRSTLVTVGLTALALAASGCSADSTSPVLDVAPVAAGTPTAAPVVEQVDTEASPTAVPSAAPSEAAKPAAPSYDVSAVQRTLRDLKYYGGSVDGRSGPALRSAVMAFQKVNGLGADGAVGPATLQALAAPKAPVLKGSAPANRVEVDLTKQVAYVVKGGAVARVLPVSSGNGATYEQKDGSTARALTPVGYYKVQRRIVGERNADLGTLYDPQYFYRGWAIHGSNSVPAGPASHGCVRVTRADAKYLLDAISVGTAVYLYGGRHTFPAGSSAPGTSEPTGDTAGNTKATTAPAPAPKPASTTPAPVPASTRPAPPQPKPTPTKPAATTPPPSTEPSPTATAAG